MCACVMFENTPRGRGGRGGRAMVEALSSKILIVRILGKGCLSSRTPPRYEGTLDLGMLGSVLYMRN